MGLVLYTPYNSVTWMLPILGQWGASAGKGVMIDPTPPYMWRPVFLNVLSRIGTVAGAARATGVSVPSVNAARRRDPEFNLQVEEARQLAVDYLEQVAWDRATRHSDQLLMFLLKAHRPDVYNRATRSELSGPDGGPIPVKAYVGFDPAVWNNQARPGDEVETIDGDFAVIPEERAQVGSSQ